MARLARVPADASAGCDLTATFRVWHGSKCGTGLQPVKTRVENPYPAAGSRSEWIEEWARGWRRQRFGPAAAATG